MDRWFERITDIKQFEARLGSVEKGVKHVYNLASDRNDLFAEGNTVSMVLVRVSNNSR